MNETIAIYPWSDNYLNDVIFTTKNLYNLFTDNDAYNPFRLLKDELKNINYDLMTIDLVENIAVAKYIIFFDMPEAENIYFKECISKGLKDRMVLFLWEPAVVKERNYSKELHRQFGVVLTWNDDLVDNRKYFKFNYPEPCNVRNPYEQKYDRKLFCTLIAGNKRSSVAGELYSERVSAIRFFERNRIMDFEFYGRGWGVPRNILKRIFRFVRYGQRRYPSYKGETENKLKTLAGYKFCICYENQKDINGYITEKIFDCFFAGTVPVYLGAENINCFIPKECFIDRRVFGSNEEMYDFLRNINQAQYENYISSIKSFLKSDEFIQFTDRFFCQNIINILKLMS